MYDRLYKCTTGSYSTFIFSLCFAEKETNFLFRFRRFLYRKYFAVLLSIL